jgi:nicotinate-nucleotide pyrophosphorylase (carboxylating)
METELIDRIIQLALDEDIQSGDHTSLATIPKNSSSKAVIIAKEQGYLSGVTLGEKIFKIVNPEIQVTIIKMDGDSVNEGDVVMKVEGPERSLLTAERTVLNFMQRLSGIATKTSRIVDLIGHTNSKLVDTRKTTPGLRILEKQAVVHGGGNNHRMGLYDMILIKDNHIDYAGGIKNTLDQTRIYLKDNNLVIKIIIEVRDEDELNQVLDHGGCHRIILDNFSPERVKAAMKIIPAKFAVEASGNINEKTIIEYAETGVHFISMGALTHSVNSLDLSMLTKTKN